MPSGEKIPKPSLLVRKSAQTRIRINHHAGRHDRNFDWEHGSISTGPVLKNLCVLAVLTLSSALVYESRVDINHWSLRISQLDTSQSLLAHSVLLTVANLKNPSQSQLKVTRCLSLCELSFNFPQQTGPTQPNGSRAELKLIGTIKLCFFLDFRGECNGKEFSSWACVVTYVSDEINKH